MTLRTLALDWRLDGPVGAAFLVLAAATAFVYLLAAKVGTRRDRRHRRWPRGRAICFLAGLTVLIVDLYSGVGTKADTRLSVHMLEHMVMWVVVAPLLAAGAPLRLAFFVLRPANRRVLARWLHARPVSALTSPVGSVALFTTVLLISHLPAIYGLALRDDYVHELEHGLYLLTAVLMWAPLVGADPLPRRPGPRGQLACVAACMAPMALIALWLGTAQHAVYGHYLATLGPSALQDQHTGATIMWTACIPAFVAPALAAIRAPRRRRQQMRSQRAPA